MLLLGVVLHLSMPYTGIILPGYYVTDERSWLLQMVLIVHYFRMPVFFLLSGFFSALIWQRGGPAKFHRVRSKRIGLVWLVSLIVLSPVMAAISVYNHFASQGGNALTLAWGAIASLQIDRSWLPDPSLHMWFLEYLMLFCLGAAAILSLVSRLLPFLDRYTEKIMAWRFRIVVLAVPTALTLWRMPFGVVPYPSSLVPRLGIALAYGWFYAVGWLIYRRRDLIPLLASRAQIEKVVAPVLLVICLLLVKRYAKLSSTMRTPLADFAIASSTALFVWSAVIGLITAVQAIKPRKWLPYLADSSYWIYLMHYSFAIVLPAMLHGWPGSPIIKVTLSTAFICGFLTADLRSIRSILHDGACLERSSPTESGESAHPGEGK
jgi:glucan biosynthesis protein C